MFVPKPEAEEGGPIVKSLSVADEKFAAASRRVVVRPRLPRLRPVRQLRCAN
jgi:hypothetical protein